jgi:hypothetical protein
MSFAWLPVDLSRNSYLRSPWLYVWIESSLTLVL